MRVALCFPFGPFDVCAHFFLFRLRVDDFSRMHACSPTFFQIQVSTGHFPSNVPLDDCLECVLQIAVCW